ncbi:hypothetical protein Hanom_Chr00s000081g01619101 [Helianthus anomalus]
MIQVWRFLATSPARYRRIQEIFTSLSDLRSCITTDTADLLIRSCFAPFCTFLYIFVFYVYGWTVGWCYNVLSLTVVKVGGVLVI